ncbi:hypothetical protein [Dysgonomonas sp. ZJ279]|uniref:hypothetical protein n=1 Tax=Dysgonomonas sp. ZJ279 TaxID=2709796 RepID=UPI0013ED7563|nr:hypothetical protein [Dysgonomonas sp. ZJ279]
MSGFKEIYRDSAGNNILQIYDAVRFASSVGNGDGLTREKPMSVRSVGLPANRAALILGGGHNIIKLTSGGSGGALVIGQGARQTVVDLTSYVDYYPNMLTLKDLTLSNAVLTAQSGIAANISASYCLFPIAFSKIAGVANVTRSIITGVVDMTRGSLSRNSFFNTIVRSTTAFRSNLSVYESCDVFIATSDIATYKDYHLSFDKCNFMIGNETVYTPLVGVTAVELRADFVRRCEAQGATLPIISEFEETNAVGRWMFTKGSVNGSLVLKGSELAAWQTKRGIFLGYSDLLATDVPIVASPNIPASMSGTNKTSGFVLLDGSISLAATVGVTDKHIETIDSKVIYFGGKKNITFLDIVNTFADKYGVFIESTDTLKNAVTVIAPSTYYVVRSSDKQFAEVSYNGVTYSTSLATRKNVFSGVAGVTSFATVSGNPIVYKVEDVAVQKTIQMRVVNELPTDIITSGSLIANYWYFVAPNNLNDTTGTITYKGVVYSCFDSFLVDSSVLTFSVQGACHLRRCWRKDYTPTSETTDKAFWATRQKPQWFEVIPNDLRCLLANNSSASNEMQADAQGYYITTGHGDFYNFMNGASGLQLPAFNISGVYMQIRLVVSTLNPM